MKIKNSRKGTEWWVIVGAIIAIVAMVVVIAAFLGLFKQGNNEAENKLKCTTDSDRDGVVDCMDQCCDTPAGADINAGGCADGETPKKDRSEPC